MKTGIRASTPDLLHNSGTDRRMAGPKELDYDMRGAIEKIGSEPKFGMFG